MTFAKSKPTVNLNEFLALILMLSPISLKADTINPQPNIVLILVDDAALMDFGVYGGEAATPNIDRLALQGTLFTNYHSSPSCAPSRAMLLTGCDSHLTGVPNLPEFLSEEHQKHEGYEGILNDKVVTVASRLKSAGYRTYMTGKWHLGNTETSLPSKRGFDRTYILGASGADNYEQRPYIATKSGAPWFEDGKPTRLPDDFYSSKDYVDKMISFMNEDPDQSKPFFSYLAFQAIHIPLQAPKEFVDKYVGRYDEGWDKMRLKRHQKAKQLGLIPPDAALGDMLPVLRSWDALSPDQKKEASNDMAVNAAMLEAMDYHIGRYFNYLTQKGLLENTVFVISSDNGPEASSTDDSKSLKYWMKWKGFHRDQSRLGQKRYYGFIGPEFASAAASPLSFFKFYAGEGGLRVPLIISGKNIPRGEKENAFAYVTDVTPTILDIAGIKISSETEGITMTGKSLFPLLTKTAEKIYYDNDIIGLESAGQCALFKGNMKLVKNGKPYGDAIWRMYNIATDPAETIDLAKSSPALFDTLMQHYKDYAVENNVLEMDDDYETLKQIEKNYFSDFKKKTMPWILVALMALGLFFIIRKKIKKPAPLL